MGLKFKTGLCSWNACCTTYDISTYMRVDGNGHTHTCHKEASLWQLWQWEWCWWYCRMLYALCCYGKSNLLFYCPPCRLNESYSSKCWAFYPCHQFPLCSLFWVLASFSIPFLFTPSLTCHVVCKSLCPTRFVVDVARDFQTLVHPWFVVILLVGVMARQFSAAFFIILHHPKLKSGYRCCFSYSHTS